MLLISLAQNHKLPLFSLLQKGTKIVFPFAEAELCWQEEPTLSSSFFLLALCTGHTGNWEPARSGGLCILLCAGTKILWVAPLHKHTSKNRSMSILSFESFFINKHPYPSKVRFNQLHACTEKTGESSLQWSSWRKHQSCLALRGEQVRSRFATKANRSAKNVPNHRSAGQALWMDKRSQTS